MVALETDQLHLDWSITKLMFMLEILANSLLIPVIMSNLPNDIRLRITREIRAQMLTAECSTVKERQDKYLLSLHGHATERMNIEMEALVVSCVTILVVY